MEDDRGVHAGAANGVRVSTARSSSQEEGRRTSIYHIVCYSRGTDPGTQFIARLILGVLLYDVVFLPVSILGYYGGS